MTLRWFRSPFLIFSGKACLLVGLFSAIVFAQKTEDRTVSANDVEQITDAVLISKITVDGQPIECGLFVKPDLVQPVTPFRASGDWLSKMDITMVNRTDKVVVYGGVMLHFLDTGDCHALPCAGVELKFGHVHPLNAFDGRSGLPSKPQHPERPAVKWEPQQTMVIHVRDYMDEIASSVSRFIPVSSISHVKIYRAVFDFDDGMIWSLGRYDVPDPKRPGKTISLPRDYFPGRPGNNWPPGYNY